MDKLISRSAVIDVIENEIKSTRDYLQHDTQINIMFKIEELPVIEAKSVVHGEWKHRNSWEYYVCSECSHEFVSASKFCPNCGAKMDGKQVA